MDAFCNCDQLCELNEYNLPTLTFVAGSTQNLTYHVYWHKNHRAYDLGTTSSKFYLTEHLKRQGAPLLTKPMTVKESDRLGERGVYNVLNVVLNRQDTVGLMGKYIYQISTFDGDKADVTYQGVMYIMDNIES